MFKWFSERRRAKLLEKYSFPDEDWEEALAPFAFFDRLGAGDRARLRQLVSLFCAEKEFVGAGEFEIKLRTQLMIAAQACLPILNLDLSFYRGWSGIIVYPGEVLVQREEVDEDGVVHQYEDVLTGEAMPGGPVVLSWEDVTLAGAEETPGYNVVIHEFAHKIDMLSGDANGAPLLTTQFHAGMSTQEWQDTMRHAYDEFCAQVGRWEARGMREEEMPLIDPYAADNAAEFFAVMSETFFTMPEDVLAAFPALYKLLARYYRQQPLGGSAS
jgi:Mlc titration factor MtfA (ptsG expression regulator)